MFIATLKLCEIEIIKYTGWSIGQFFCFKNLFLIAKKPLKIRIFCSNIDPKFKLKIIQ